MNNIAAGLERMNQEKTLSFFGNSPVQIALERIDQVKTLSFPNGYEIVHREMEEIVYALNRNRAVETLDFRYNRIDNKGIKVLVYDTSRFNPNLKTFNFGHNLIGNDGAIAIGNMLKTNSTIETLNLEDNKIQNGKGIYTIVNALATNKTLTTLNLKNNGLDIEVAEAIRYVLDFKFPIGNATITTIKLGNICGYDDEIIQDIKEKLKENRRRKLFYILELIRKRKRKEEDPFWKGMPRQIVNLLIDKILERETYI